MITVAFDSRTSMSPPDSRHSIHRFDSSSARAGVVAFASLLFAAGCWGITSGPEQLDTSFDRDTTQCTKQVKQCTCYCAVRCGDACVKRLCYDPCSDGRSDTDRPPFDVSPRETGTRDAGPPRDSTGPTDADDAAGPDAGTDTAPQDTASDTLAPTDTQTGGDADEPPDAGGQDGTAAEDSSD